jgi:hypothetical protein
MATNDFVPTQSAGGENDLDNLSMRLQDENRVAYGVKQINGKPRVSSMPYTYDIAEGNVTDHKSWNKIGYAGTVSATELDIAPWTTGSYVFPVAGSTMTIVSSSTADTLAGTACQKVTVYYLDEAYGENIATISMNGTAPVQIGTGIFRVNNARVSQVGAGFVPTGNLTIAAGGVTYGYISAGRTRMRQAIWTVPANKTLYVTQIAFSCAGQGGGKYARFTTRANFDNLSGLVLQRGLFQPYNEVVLNNTGYFRELNPPTKLSSTVDLKVSAVGDATAQVTCALRGWLE